MCGITVFLLKLNSQKNTGANNQAIDGHLQENREETNNLYGFIMSKSWSIITLEGHAKESICHTPGFHFSLFRITSDLDDDICKRMILNREKSEALHVNWNNPLPQ